jgi:hypothetical protein
MMKHPLASNGSVMVVLISPFAIGLELTDNRRCYAEELLSTNRNLRRDQRGPA